MSKREHEHEKSVYIKLLKSYASFRKSYNNLIKGGFLAIVIIPIIFLLLMFSLEAKIVFLVLWIVSIIVCAVFIIVIEYTDYHYKKMLDIPSNIDINEYLKDKINELEKEQNITDLEEHLNNEKSL